MAIIEHELVREGDDDHAPLCDHCGGDMWWEDCWQCGGEGGEYPHEYSPIEYDPDEFKHCDICAGAGGYWLCANSREWCAAHPLPPATPDAATAREG